VSDFFLQFLKEFLNQNAEEENRPKKKAWEADGKTERTEDQTWKTGYGWICMQCSYGMWPVSKKAEKSCFLLLLSVNSKVKLVYRGSKCRAAGTYLNMARTDLLEMDLVLIRSGGPEMKFVDSNQTNICKRLFSKTH